jgi:hypothetical protein
MPLAWLRELERETREGDGESERERERGRGRERSSHQIFMVKSNKRRLRFRGLAIQRATLSCNSAR